MGEHDPHNLACVLVADAYWNLVGPTAAFGRCDRLDADRILSWYRAHAGELRQATRDGRYAALLSDGRLPASAAGPVLANIRRVAPDACDRFLGLLADPATPVRRRLDEGLDRSDGRGSIRFNAALLVKCWNLTGLGASLPLPF